MWPIKVYTAETLVFVDATIVEFSKIMNVKEYYRSIVNYIYVTD